jgi:esterase/lipase superfamily enzyme
MRSKQRGSERGEWRQGGHIKLMVKSGSPNPPISILGGAPTAGLKHAQTPFASSLPSIVYHYQRCGSMEPNPPRTLLWQAALCDAEARWSPALERQAISKCAWVRAQLVAPFCAMMDSLVALELALLQDEFIKAVGEEVWKSFATELAELLFASEADMDAENLRVRLDAWMDRVIAYPAAEEWVRGALAAAEAKEAETTRGTLSVQAGAGGAIAKGFLEVPIYYCTDRARRDDPDPRRKFTGDRGEVSYGVAKVSIPFDHEVGHIEEPKWWKGQFRQDPTKHVVLLEIAACGREDFVGSLKTALATADARDVLIFVHGYNVDFESAAKRAAQMTVDLKFPGRAVLYSWPSKADTKQYFVDEATIEWSLPHFEDFLHLCLTELGATHGHLLAHSMGNRLAVRAIENLSVESLPKGSASLHHLVCAAADVDGQVFRRVASKLAARTRRVTLYVSDHDKALLASRLLHYYPRAGEAGSRLLVTEGVDTIDASGVDTGLFALGHSFFSSSRSIVNDIFSLFGFNAPPDKRFDMKPMHHPDGGYWAYRP